MTEPECIVDVKNISKRFGDVVAVDRLSMKIRQGEIYGFLGPNGSGKTTFIRILCGLLTPDSGEGTCLGYDILRQSSMIKRQVGYMTQRFSHYEDLTVRENLDFVARVYGIQNQRQAVEESLEKLGLQGRHRQLAGTLSGGWKQRLALAACMLHKPDLLLLDEPTAGVDPKARRDFWEEIHRLAAHGLTVLIATHYMDEAERCHQLAYIAYGHLLSCGSVDEVIAQAGLITWEVSGPRLFDLGAILRTLPGVEHVVPFGRTLHVSGTEKSLMERSVAPYQCGEFHWEPIPSNLEDVFVSLMERTRDNIA